MFVEYRLCWSSQPNEWWERGRRRGSIGRRGCGRGSGRGIEEGKGDEYGERGFTARSHRSQWAHRTWSARGSSRALQALRTGEARGTVEATRSRQTSNTCTLVQWVSSMRRRYGRPNASLACEATRAVNTWDTARARDERAGLNPKVASLEGGVFGLEGLDMVVQVGDLALVRVLEAMEALRLRVQGGLSVGGRG